MNKNWLIRTKSNHILGPISKEKVLELYKNGSIKADDEICSGNGFWFFIREDELVKRYLLGDEPQGFNPISEAKDILTKPKDLTVVGLNIASLLEKDKIPETVPLKETPAISPETPKELPEGSKKKNNVTKNKVTEAPQKYSPPLKKQNFLKYIGIIGFIILFCLIYYRKTVIKTLFKGEIISALSIIPDAHADEAQGVLKKRILDSATVYEKVTFSPVIGLEGFRVVSSFNIEDVNCSDFNNDIYQLGVLLYSPEVINENFLIKMRDCVVKLDENHPLKKWIKWIGAVRPISKETQEQRDFLLEIINSQYNLITDLKLKTQITNTLVDIPEKTIPEKILKSYLYLIIGNVSRSDKILRDFINQNPKESWIENHSKVSTFHVLAKDQLRQIFKKLEKHPADRSAFQLFLLYLKTYFNDEALLNIVSDFSTSSIESKLDLKFFRGMAPNLVDFFRLSGRSENRRLTLLRDLERYPLTMQAYWVWPFININPLVSEEMSKELKKLEKEDELWFIYLLNNERLADMYYKTGKSFLPARREFLKKTILEKKHSMMAIYKLIEMGDINDDLINKTRDTILYE